MKLSEYRKEMKRRGARLSSFNQWKDNARNLARNTYGINLSEFTNEKDMFAAFWDKISPTEHVDSCARRYNLIKMVK